MTQDGECYTGYVEEVVKELDEWLTDKIVVIKSTIIRELHHYV